MIRNALLTLGLVLAVGSQSALAGMYKWTDEEGNVHYGEQPPRDQPVQRMKAPPAPPSERGYEPPTLAGKNEDGNGQPADPAQARKRAELMEKNCEAARNNLKVYTAHRRIKQGDEVIVLDDDERQRRIDQAKRNIERFCK